MLEKKRTEYKTAIDTNKGYYEELKQRPQNLFKETNNDTHSILSILLNLLMITSLGKALSNEKIAHSSMPEAMYVIYI